MRMRSSGATVHNTLNNSRIIKHGAAATNDHTGVHVKAAAQRWRRRAHATANFRKAAHDAIGEVIVYLIFIVFYTISAVVVVQDQAFFWYGDLINQQLKGDAFDSISSAKDFHSWLQGPLYTTLYTDVPLDGSTVPDKPGYVFGVTKVVGGVRISQLRVHERACADTTPSYVSRFKFEDSSNGFRCYGDNNGGFDTSVESSDAFGTFSPAASGQFTWEGYGASTKTQAEARDAPLSGVRSGFDRTYPYPGFAVVLPNNNATAAKMLLTALAAGKYVDPRTRLLMVEVTMFNPNLDMWVQYDFTVESPKAGGFRTSASFNTVKLYSMFEDTRTWAIVLEIAVCLFVAGYIVFELVKLVKVLRRTVPASCTRAKEVLHVMSPAHRRAAAHRVTKVGAPTSTAAEEKSGGARSANPFNLQNSWRTDRDGAPPPETKPTAVEEATEVASGNQQSWFMVISHNINLFAFVLVYVFRANSFANTPDADTVTIDSDSFYFYRSAVEYRISATHMQSVTAFLIWFKLLRYASFVPKFALVTKTLYYSVSEVGGFMIVFFAVFYGFSAAFMIAFGKQVLEYRNLRTSAYSLLRSLLGDFNLGQLVGAQYLLGIVMFSMFVAVAILVVLNVLIAIISDAYTRAKDSLEHCPQVDVGEEITDVFRELGHNIKAAARWCLCGWCRKRRSSPDATVTPVANDAQPTPVSPVKEAAPATQQATGADGRVFTNVQGIPDAETADGFRVDSDASDDDDEAAVHVAPPMQLGPVQPAPGRRPGAVLPVISPLNSSS